MYDICQNDWLNLPAICETERQRFFFGKAWTNFATPTQPFRPRIINYVTIKKWSEELPTHTKKEQSINLKPDSESKISRIIHQIRCE